MIGINVISIAQSVNLASGQLNNILVLQLPDGTEVNAVVPESVVDKIYAMVSGSAPTKQAAAAPPEPPKFRPGPASWEEQAPPAAAPAAAPPEPGLLRWEEIPDEQLSEQMKAAFRSLQVPAELTVHAINKLIEQVNERFGPEEWAAVAVQPSAEEVMPHQRPQPAPQPPPAVPTTGLRPPGQQAAPRPPVGQVAWSDGSPMLPGQQNRGRTVAANSAGFPIPNDGSVDPGEVVAGGEEGDEDGVAQF